MRSLRRSDATKPIRRDPAPSRWGYRYQRMMLTPSIRKLLKFGLPALAIGVLIGGWSAKDSNRQLVVDAYTDMKTQIQQRDEFMIKLMAVDGADETLAADIRQVLPLEFPVSTFEVDLEEMRQLVAALPAVAEASLRVRPGGVLTVTVAQRLPVAVFRADDGLRLIDEEGVLIQSLGARGERPDLPLITGDGAREALAEGLEIYAVSGPLQPNMRGVVRMGARRWDVILDSGQRILLPSEGAVPAFERVVALNQAQELLGRDVSVVDMRHTHRPTVRLNENAVNTLRQTALLQSTNN